MIEKKYVSIVNFSLAMVMKTTPGGGGWRERGSGKLPYEKVGNAVYLFHVSCTRQIKLTLCLGWSLKGVLFKCSDKNS